MIRGDNDDDGDDDDANTKLPSPPTRADIIAFEQHDAVGPTREDFAVDYLGPVKSKWNCTAARVFRESFAASSLYPAFASLDVENGFLTYLEGTLRNRYRRQIGDVDSEDDATRCAKSSRNSRLRTVWPGICSLSLYTDAVDFQLRESRLQVCRREADLQRFEPHVQQLADCGGMSMDESDHHSSSRTSERKYVIVRPEWRAPPISDFLHVMDNVWISHRFQKPSSGKGRATPGNWPCLRISARHRVDQSRDPVPGLPKNFYDQRWLAGMSEESRRSLNMKPAVDITHTPQILEYVLLSLSIRLSDSLFITTFRLSRRFERVRKRGDQPIPPVSTDRPAHWQA